MADFSVNDEGTLRFQGSRARSVELFSQRPKPCFDSCCRNIPPRLVLLEGFAWASYLQRKSTGVPRVFTGCPFVQPHGEHCDGTDVPHPPGSSHEHIKVSLIKW